MAARPGPDGRCPVAPFQLYKQMPTENNQHHERYGGRRAQSGGKEAAAQGQGRDPENTQTHDVSQTEGGAMAVGINTLSSKHASDTADSCVKLEETALFY